LRSAGILSAPVLGKYRRLPSVYYFRLRYYVRRIYLPQAQEASYHIYAQDTLTYSDGKRLEALHTRYPSCSLESSLHDSSSARILLVTNRRRFSIELRYSMAVLARRIRGEVW